MNEPEEGSNIETRAKALFDASVEQLDAATLSRLNRQRHRALEELDGRRRHAVWLRWVPATGIAAAAVLTVMIMNPSATPVPEGPVSASDFELLLEDVSLDMLEDLEFYLWLESTDMDAAENVG